MAEINDTKGITSGLAAVTEKLSTTNQTLDDVKDKIIEGSREEAEQANELFKKQNEAQAFNESLGRMSADVQRTNTERVAEAIERVAEKEEAKKAEAQAETDAAARKALGISQSRLELARSMDEKIKEQEKTLKATADVLKKEGKDIKDSKQYRKEHIELLKMQKKRAQVIGSKTAEDKADKELQEQKRLTFLGNIAKGIGSIAKRTADAIKKKVTDLKGFLFAGFALAALAFMNHPKFKEMTDFLIDTLVPILVFLWEKVIKPIGLWLGGKITDLFLSIKDAIDGKTGWWAVLRDNKAILGLIVAGLALKVLGFKGILIIIKSLPAMLTAIKVAFAGMSGPLGALLTPLLPIIGIIALISLAIYSLKQAFDDFAFELEATGSVWEATKTAIMSVISNIIGFPLNLLKDSLSWLIGKIGSIFGIEAFTDISKAMDDFDFIEGIRELLTFVGNAISSLWDGVIAGVQKLLRKMSWIGGGAIADKIFGTEKQQKLDKKIEEEEQKQFELNRIALKEKKKEDEAKFAKMRAEATKKSREELGIPKKAEEAYELEKLMRPRPGAGTDIMGGIQARAQARAASPMNITDAKQIYNDNKQTSTTISQTSMAHPSPILRHIMTAS